jgi:hypothetical protein
MKHKNMYDKDNKDIKNNKNNKKGGSQTPYLLTIPKIGSKHDNFDNYKIKKAQLRLSPLSGSENDYDPDKWNKILKIKDTNNCYAYAMGKTIPKLSSKPQPGYASGFTYSNTRNFECASYYERLKKDNPGTYLTQFDESCIPGFYKVFLALDVGNDYHWWRQDSNQLWSHKPGSTDVVNKDGSGELIENPLISNRKFRVRNYSTPCFFSCINSDLSRVLDEIYH